MQLIPEAEENTINKFITDKKNYTFYKSNLIKYNFINNDIKLDLFHKKYLNAIKKTNENIFNPSDRNYDGVSFAELNGLENSSQFISLLLWFRQKIRKHPSTNENELRKLILAFDKLANCEDNLVELILENCAIDILLHGLKIELNPYEATASSKVKFGQFKQKNKLIEIFNHSPDVFAKTLIHELTHAMCFFAFTSQYLSSIKKPPTSFVSLFKQVEMLNGLPCPINSNEQFNPAYLKFRQCVRSDLTHQQNNGCHLLLSDFFNAIQRNYQTNILDNKGLGEIFSFYMEMRFSLLQSYSRDNAMTILENNLPHIHAYFETDIKKILQSRLTYFMPELNKYHLSSKCSAVQKNKINTEYQEDGTVELKKKSFKRKSI